MDAPAEIKRPITVSIDTDPDPDITTDVEIVCIYASCSNMVAFEQGELSTGAAQVQELGYFGYQVGSEAM